MLKQTTQVFRSILLGLLAACAPLALADYYTAQRIDPREDSEAVWARGINDKNAVVGDWRYIQGGNEMRRGFVWSQSFENPKLKVLGTLGGTSNYRWTYANDINNQSNAMIVGKSRNSSGTYKAFYCRINSYGTLTALGDGGGVFGWDSEAKAANDDGIIVGWGRVGSNQGAIKPFRYSTSMVQLGPNMTPAAGGTAITIGNGAATGINNLGRICGYAQRNNTSGPDRAFWSSGSGNLRELPIPGGYAASEANAINNHNIIVGAIRTSSGAAQVPCIWLPDGSAASGYQCHLIPNILGDAAEALGIGDSNVVGGTVRIGGAWYGFIYENSTMYRADSYQGPNPNYSANGRLIRRIESVSNSVVPGLVGYGIDPNQANRAEGVLLRKAHFDFAPPGEEHQQAIGSVVTTGGESSADFVLGQSQPLQMVARLYYGGVADPLASSLNVALSANDPDVGITPATQSVVVDNFFTSAFTVTPGPGTAGKTITVRVNAPGYSGEVSQFTLRVAPHRMTLTGANRAGKTRETVMLSATLLRDGTPAEARPVYFLVNGQNVGVSDTNASGLAVVSYMIPDGLGAGTFPIRAVYNGMPSESTAEQTTTLTVARGDLVMATDNFTAAPGTTLTLRSSVRSAQDNQPIASFPVTFTLDGTPIGTQNTSATGIAVLGYTVPEDSAPGVRNIAAVTTQTPAFEAGQATGTITVQARLSGLTVDPSVVVGGSPTVGRVSLNGPTQGQPLTVNLTSGSSAIGVPSSVNVAVGQDSATFPISTQAVAAVATRTITASQGGLSFTAAITLMPGLQSLTVTPSTVPGGTSTTGTITLYGPAHGRGQQVTVSSNSSALLVPSSVLVEGGARTATFEIRTLPVGVTSVRTVSATLGPVTRSANVTITTGLSRFTISPDRVVGGQTSTGTVTLSGPAPAGGLAVSLVSGSSAIQVPSSIVVPAGASTASFTIGTSRVGAVATRYVTATLGSASRQAVLTLTP